MYHAFVRRRLRRGFEHDLSEGNYPALVARTAGDVVQTFPGHGALAGTRRSRKDLEAWFERLFRLFPILRFEVEEIAVTGGPWRTIVTVCWRDWGEAADGEIYENRGCEVFEIRWGRAVSIRQYLDTKVIHDSLDRMAAAGIEEATAPPLCSPLSSSPIAVAAGKTRD
jgi:ketosteroid isomerase-like protein